MNTEEPTQANYQETPYEDASWEMVGDSSLREEFFPLEIEVIEGSEAVADPLFADYGGVMPGQVRKRWHLPEELAYQGAARELAGEEPHEEQVPHLSVTEEQLETIRADAFAAGQAQALESAKAGYERALHEIQENAIAIFADLKSQLLDQLQLVEKQAVELAISVARRLVFQAVEINPEYLIPLMHEAFAHVGAAEVQQVRVSPEDLEFINMIGLAEQLKEHDGKWSFVADPSIQAGCVVDTSAGHIDFQLDQAWDRVRDQVMRAVR